jgi:hypothetical protein
MAPPVSLKVQPPLSTEPPVRGATGGGAGASSSGNDGVGGRLGSGSVDRNFRAEHPRLL